MTRNEKRLGMWIAIGFVAGLVASLLPAKYGNLLIAFVHARIANCIKNRPETIVYTNARLATTGEVFRSEMISNGPCPVITDQGVLLCTHGSVDGKLGVVDEGKYTFVQTNDNRFTDIFNAGLNFPIQVLACYPATRPSMWFHNGRWFNTPSHQYNVPMILPCIDGTLYYSPMPEKLAKAFKLDNGSFQKKVLTEEELPETVKARLAKKRAE
jgi:hypothetical protein